MVNFALLTFHDDHQKRRDQSSVWFHFLRDETKQYAKCKDPECLHVLKIHGGSTSNLHTHLLRKHNFKVNLGWKEETSTTTTDAPPPAAAKLSPSSPSPDDDDGGHGQDDGPSSPSPTRSPSPVAVAADVEVGGVGEEEQGPPCLLCSLPTGDVRRRRQRKLSSTRQATPETAAAARVKTVCQLLDLDLDLPSQPWVEFQQLVQSSNIHFCPSCQELVAAADSLFDKIKQLESQVSKVRSEVSRRLSNCLDSEPDPDPDAESLKGNLGAWKDQNSIVESAGHLRRQLLRASLRHPRRQVSLPSNQQQGQGQEILVPGRRLTPAETKCVFDEEIIKCEPHLAAADGSEDFDLVEEMGNVYPPPSTKFVITEPGPEPEVPLFDPAIGPDPDPEGEIDFNDDLGSPADAAAAESPASNENESDHGDSDWSPSGTGKKVGVKVKVNTQAKRLKHFKTKTTLIKSKKNCALLTRTCTRTRSKISEVRVERVEEPQPDPDPENPAAATVAKARSKLKITVVRHHHRARPGKKLKLTMTKKQQKKNRKSPPSTLFPCIIPGCSATFATTRFRGTHLRVVHSVRRKYYQCPYCPKLLQSSRPVFEAHVRRHTGEVAFICEECGQGFKSHTCLQRHSIKHKSGPEANPFPCPHPGCPKIFARKDHLNQHSRVHVLTRDFMCELCGQAFKAKAELYIHRSKRHANNSRLTSDLTCRICGTIFSSEAQRDIHETIHGELGFLRATPTDVALTSAGPSDGQALTEILTFPMLDGE